MTVGWDIDHRGLVVRVMLEDSYSTIGSDSDELLAIRGVAEEGRSWGVWDIFSTEET